MTKKNMLLTMLMVVINNWLLNMVLTMGLMITVKNKNDKVSKRGGVLSMEALTIDEIISAKKNFLNIDKDLNLIHSVNETKETYYLIHCVAIITFLLLKQQALAESSAIMLLVVIYFLHRWEFHLSHMIIHNVLLFSHLFEKKYAYELLDKLNLCDQDYGKIRHVMSEFYKKEGM